MRDNVRERRAVEQSGRQDVQGVKPATRLADVLDDEVARVVRLEPFLVLERVVNLRVRHRTRLEPAVENVRDTAHHRLARRIIRVRANQLIDERAVQVIHLHAEVALKFLKRTVDVFTRVVRVI